MDKGDKSVDPRGLIHESYRIDGLGEPEARSIFLDWALDMPLGEDVGARLDRLLELYAGAHPEHPMTLVIREGQAKARAPMRRGGRAGRVSG